MDACPEPFPVLAPPTPFELAWPAWPAERTREPAWRRWSRRGLSFTVWGVAWVLGSVWIAALGGAVLRIFWPRGFRRLAVPFYLALGWAGLALFWPGAGEASLGLATVILCAVGGMLYTLGVPFLLAERLRFHNAIWHGFVLVATFVFYAAVLAEMGLRAAAAPG